MHTDSELDNPIWASLRSRHRHLARGGETALGFSPEYAPFVGVAGDEVDTSELRSIIPHGANAYLLGIAPRIAHGNWRLESFPRLAQMTCRTILPTLDGPEIMQLDHAHRADVLALTALVYPHYFRERTMELGRYFGIYRDGNLAAMIGERLATDAAQEISAICTHPDFAGRGYARRLLTFLTNDIVRADRLPFLHVAHENIRAQRLYTELGYCVRRDIDFWSLRRSD